jgi:hypothetical protein
VRKPIRLDVLWKIANQIIQQDKEGSLPSSEGPSQSVARSAKISGSIAGRGRLEVRVPISTGVQLLIT